MAVGLFRSSGLPVHEGPQGAPEHPLPASSRVAVRVEESHSRAAVLSAAGLAATLQPRAEPQQNQEQQQGQGQAEVDAGHHQGPQQPAAEGDGELRAGRKFT